MAPLLQEKSMCLVYAFLLVKCWATLSIALEKGFPDSGTKPKLSETFASVFLLSAVWWPLMFKPRIVQMLFDIGLCLVNTRF